MRPLGIHESRVIPVSHPLNEREQPKSRPVIALAVGEAAQSQERRLSPPQSIANLLVAMSDVRRQSGALGLRASVYRCYTGPVSKALETFIG